MARRSWWLAVALVVHTCVAALAHAEAPATVPATLPAVPQAGLAADPVLDERVNRLASELRCLVCQNQTIADSQAELAVQLKHEVRQQLSRGASEAEVRDFMVQRYGEFVLYRPPVNPATWLLWSGPALLLLVGLVVLGLHWRARRWQGQQEPDGWEGGDAAALDDDVVPPQEGRTP